MFAALLLSAVMASSPPPSQPPAQADAAKPSAELVAAGWCVARSHSQDASGPGCDAGLGVSLQRWGRVAIVAAVGAHTAGTGLAWLAGYAAGKPIAISIGVVAPYDAHGIDLHGRGIAVGATFGFK